jgi:hypothetical protein
MAAKQSALSIQTEAKIEQFRESQNVKTIQPRRGGNALVFGAFRPGGGGNAEDVVGFT